METRALARLRRAVSGRSSHRRSANSALRAATSPLIEPLEGRQLLAATYYVSAAGSDSAAGTSIATAWKSVARANAQQLHAGDTVLFAGGQSFSGTLSVLSSEGGSSTTPVSFGSFGTGRATIRSGTSGGMDIAQVGGISVHDLNFVGSGMTTNLKAGIYHHVEWNSRNVTFLRINNVDVSGYGLDDIRIRVQGIGSSLNDVKISNANLHDSLYGGIRVQGSADRTLKNYVIDHVKAYNHPGSKLSKGVTGSGIWVSDVDGCTINRCVSHDNGKDGSAPVGIWTDGANRVTIQYCESYNNHTATVTDGGGFDFDWDVTNSTMQYNYSHNNDGPGYLLGAGFHVNTGNTIRYNVSENDGRRNGRAGIHLWGNIKDASIYNNVIYMTSTGNSNSSTFYIHNAGANGLVPNNVQVRNNVFYTTGGVKLLNLTADIVNKSINLNFSGNCYYAAGSTMKLVWGNDVYNSLSAWQTAKGQEKFNGVNTGFEGDPKLVGVGTGGTLDNADLLKNLGGYKLQATSPLVNRGVSPPTFLAAAITDFYGDTLPKGGKFDIGIDEIA